MGIAQDELNAVLASELLERLAVVDPFRFEQIVVDLLFAMGYGGSREQAVQVTKKSNAEGIDGIINEDRLGLDVIYVQAKRWQNVIGRKEIQSFVGALAGKQANKGGVYHHQHICSNGDRLHQISGAKGDSGRWQAIGKTYDRIQHRCFGLSFVLHQKVGYGLF